MKYRVLALWNQFRTQVIPADAPPVQVKEMRRAFYAGVECTLNRLGDEMSSGDATDDPADEQAVREVAKELQDFAADCLAGRA